MITLFFRKKKKEISTNDKATIDLKSSQLEDFVEKKSPEKEFLTSVPDEELAKAISGILKKSKSN